MEIPYIVDQIMSYVPTIDWSVSANNEPVSLFETTIRYLGGILSGYDLLTGPLNHLANAENQGKIPLLLDQARSLANNLSYAFDTPTGIPSNNLYFNNHSTDGSTTNGLATIGSLVLEWTHLSDLTGDGSYGQLAQKGESYLLSPRPVSMLYAALVRNLALTRYAEVGAAMAGTCWNQRKHQHWLVRRRNWRMERRR